MRNIILRRVGEGGGEEVLRKQQFGAHINLKNTLLFKNLGISPIC